MTLPTLRPIQLCLLACFLLSACSVYDRSAALSEGEALNLAAELANERCQADFHYQPFDVNSYLIEYREQRWHWGRLDPPGSGGFCARVSFDSRGRDPEVEVCFNSDAAPPLPPSTDTPER